MQYSAVIMGMPVRIHIVGKSAKKEIASVFSYLRHIDETYSTYKKTSEISQINAGFLAVNKASKEVQHVLQLCEQTKQETNGYFAMQHKDKIDPSGIVKGYAIHTSAEMLKGQGFTNFSVEIAGDIELVGKNENGENWRVGIQNPFAPKEIIKVVTLSDQGIATSGNYMQGNHIYNPITKKMADDIASMTVIGKNVYEADRFATAAFAMGEKGIQFIENLAGFEGYMVTKKQIAVMTTGFANYVATN